MLWEKSTRRSFRNSKNVGGRRLRKQPGELANIYNGIGKFIIVDIALDRERDNPQLIFESLNSTGLRLSQADLIRNYVLMGLERGLQTELYNKYWYPMEQTFGHAECAAHFDRFMRDDLLKLYIAYKTDTNFVDIIPQKSGLRLSLNMRFDEIEDPGGICRDITGLGKWGNGDVEVRVSSLDDIDSVMPLIHQSFEKHFDGNTTTMD